MHFSLAPLQLEDIVTGYQQRKPEKLKDLEILESLGGVPALIKGLGVDPAKGLSGDDTAERRRFFGSNMRPPPKVRTFCRVLCDVLGDFILRLLIGAAVVSIILNMIFDEDKTIGIF